MVAIPRSPGRSPRQAIVPTGGQASAAALGAPGTALADFGATLTNVAAGYASRLKEAQAKLQRIDNATALGEARNKAPRIAAAEVARSRTEDDPGDRGYTDRVMKRLDAQLWP